jgi:hypothetical protein
MKTTIKKENVLLFIGIGLLIVIFLNYNNLVLYKKNEITNKTNTDTINNLKHNNNNIEGFNDDTGDTTTSDTTTTTPLPEFVLSNSTDDLTLIERLNKFIQFVVPSQDSSKTPPIAYYNVLKIKTKNFIKEVKNLGSNNFYSVNKNKYINGGNVTENVFVNTDIDLRKQNSGSYPLTTTQSLINLGKGLSIDIGFLFNYKYPNSNIVPVNVIIKERGMDTERIYEEINSYEHDELQIIPNTDTEFDLVIKLPNDAKKYPHLNYFKQNDNTSQKLYHKITIKLKLKTDIKDITTVDADDENIPDKFPDLLKEINTASSKLTYSIYDNDFYSDDSDDPKKNILFEFESQFMVDLLNSKANLNEYTKNKLQSLHMETLNDNYNEIVSDMFNLDNKISKKEKIINDVKQHYLFNEISNLQNNIKFYNTY